MKARVKATREIIEFSEFMHLSKDDKKTYLKPEDLEFLDLPKDEPDYWEKLKHQYTGMALQGILSNPEQMGLDDIECVELSVRMANLLINKLKEDSQCEK